MGIGDMDVAGQKQVLRSLLSETSEMSGVPNRGVAQLSAFDLILWFLSGM